MLQLFPLGINPGGISSLSVLGVNLILQSNHFSTMLF